MTADPAISGTVDGVCLVTRKSRSRVSAIPQPARRNPAEPFAFAPWFLAVFRRTWTDGAAQTYGNSRFGRILGEFRRETGSL